MFDPVAFTPRVGGEEAAHGLLPFGLSGSRFFREFHHSLKQSFWDARRFVTVLIRHFAEAEDADAKIRPPGQFLAEDESPPER